jgi:hypothetical protein
MQCSQPGKSAQVYHADLMTESKRTLDRKVEKRNAERETVLMLSAAAKPG